MAGLAARNDPTSLTFILIDFKGGAAFKTCERLPHTIGTISVGRDSLSAVAWSAAVLERRDPEAVVAMLSADHIITPVEGFRTTLERAFDVAETRPRALVTMGVVPTEPHTGFGYLHRDGCVDEELDAWRVSEFKEKPELRVAEHYLASGEYWWNAGMFVWRVY